MFLFFEKFLITFLFLWIYIGCQVDKPADFAAGQGGKATDNQANHKLHREP